MAFFVCCIFCMLLTVGSTTATAAPTAPIFYTITRDTTPPDNSRVVKVKELPSKKRSKQVRIKERKPKPQKKVEKVKKTQPKAAPKPAKEEKGVEQKVIEKKKKAIPPVQETAPITQKEPTPQENAVQTTPKKGRSNTKQPSLSAEEELRLLAQAPATTAEQRAPVLSQEQCAFAFDQVDEFTGTRKRGLAPRLFFSYTPEKYRQFLKTEDFISCQGYLSQSSEGGMALNMTLKIASSAAKAKFGDLPPNSNMTLKTMQGKEFFLMSYKGSKAEIRGESTVYECSFVITKADAKQLAGAEVDQVRLRFTEGFQIYEVYYLDFLREQFPCFER